MTDERLALAEGATVWTEAIAERRDLWLFNMSKELADQIGLAMDRIRSRGLRFADVDLPEFALPGWREELGAFDDAMTSGVGFGLIRGLPAEQYTPEELEMVFWLVGSQMGTPMAQNPAGDLVGHVRDHGQSFAMGRVRGYRTKESLAYHSDYADAVGLLCVQTSKSGGESTLISSGAVYNEIGRRSPALQRVLTEPFYFDRQGEEPEGEHPFHRCPVFSWASGQLSAHYSRRQIDNAQVHDAVTAMTDEQRAALDLMDEVLADPELVLHMEFERGDIQFLSNYSVLHSRTAFEDYEEPERKRHLLRLWLTMNQKWPLEDEVVEAARFANLAWEDATERGRTPDLLSRLGVPT